MLTQTEAFRKMEACLRAADALVVELPGAAEDITDLIFEIADDADQFLFNDIYWVVGSVQYDTDKNAHIVYWIEEADGLADDAWTAEDFRNAYKA